MPGIRPRDSSRGGRNINAAKPISARGGSLDALGYQSITIREMNIALPHRRPKLIRAKLIGAGSFRRAARTALVARVLVRRSMGEDLVHDAELQRLVSLQEGVAVHRPLDVL